MFKNLLIQTHELASQLDEILSNDLYLPVFVGSEESFLAGHIPGSALIQPRELVCGIPPAAGKIADEDLLVDLFSRLGLSEETVIIAYDDEGGGWAGRLIWTLDVLGHQNYHYLDGGLVAWRGDDLIQSREYKALPTTDSKQLRVHPEQLISVSEINHLIGTENFSVWDARSLGEYRGENVLAARGGHIPGAFNLNWLDLMDRQNGLRLQPFDIILAMLAEQGLSAEAINNPNHLTVTHCQSHHRSGLSYLVGKLLNMNIKAYDGSWSEWGNLANTPIETGPDFD